jgi:uncharacterized protein YeaO (DUF488 family)
VRIDEWWKEFAPSDELRKWFRHDPRRWAGFRQSYRKELQEQQKRLKGLVAEALREPITLLYSARDRERNNATALEELLEELFGWAS